MKNLKEITEFRHTVKVYNDKKSIPKDTFNEIMEFVRFAPNSFNFQTTRLLSVDRNSDLNNDLKEEKYMMINKGLVGQADKIIYFVVPKRGTKPTMDNQFIRDGIKYAAFQRATTVDKVTEEMIDQAGEPVLGAWAAMGFTDLGQWSIRQAYIYLGYLTMASASQGVDTTSMEGFFPEAITEYFRSKGLITENEEIAVASAMGYRLNETVFNKSERKPMDVFLKEV